MINKIFDSHRKDDFKEQKIKILWIFIVMLICINLFIFIGFIGIKTSLKNQRLYITPGEITQGGYYQTNIIPNAIVGGFAYQMFVAINTWATDGVKDYQTNIIQYRYYLTPEYENYLQADLKKSVQNGDLQDTVQTLSPYGTIDGTHVKQIDDNTWIVDLPLRVTHYKDATVVMDAIYDYQVRIVRTASSIQYNPWGLAIDSVLSSTRIKTLV